MMSIEERLERIECVLLGSVKNVLNVRETAIMLNLSESRIRHLVSERSIPHYKQGSKIFFKKQELEDWMLAQRVPTMSEIHSKASTYSVLNK